MQVCLCVSVCGVLYIHKKKKEEKKKRITSLVPSEGYDMVWICTRPRCCYVKSRWFLLSHSFPSGSLAPFMYFERESLFLHSDCLPTAIVDVCLELAADEAGHAVAEP
jgi:hypothetical protein